MVKSGWEKAGDVLIAAILVLIGLSAVLPLMYVATVSITPISEVMKNGGFILVPKRITFEAYRELLLDESIRRAFGVTLFVTVAGTALNLGVTTLMAYPLSRKQLVGREGLLLLIVFTMLFGGGIIPTYLVVKATGLLNSIWALIVPGLLSAFNMLIMKSFFEQLPEELFESARMDGAKELRLLRSIVVPLSVPVLLTVGLFYLVGNWNQFFAAILYITDSKLYPLQVIVRQILMQALAPVENVDGALPSEAIRMASVIIATLPVVVVYPFIQRYFTQGMMLGSIKG
ncbi:carbohydrate ABC transporter permease [Paenibacillus flagellatus]|uniref:ABC transporter permease n=1 Tax=Paenibacillus flagellatus TaxID=2211139 RepID=A0A2V5K850_9BACL|nr:carbohydrate ABC transporter permease [Paenibacillus flagellatus]PYI55538.1 ABC transporter permease [Paenibacillus flagellatus]